MRVTAWSRLPRVRHEDLCTPTQLSATLRSSAALAFDGRPLVVSACLAPRVLRVYMDDGACNVAKLGFIVDAVHHHRGKLEWHCDLMSNIQETEWGSATGDAVAVNQDLHPPAP